MQPGETWEDNGRTFEMIKVNHIVPAVGYRVADDDGSFAFSGDTTTNDSFWEALNAHPTLDMLIVEAAFADHNLELSKLAKHYCPSLLAEDMVKLRHNPEIYISHRKPGEEERILQECREHMPDRKLQPLSDGEVFAL
jgi:ribonuclease BN (tRNA processing enzyme)